MAVVINQIPGKDQDQNGNTAGAAQTPGVSSSMGVAPASASQAPKAGTGFTNIQKYIQANQGSGERLAGRLGQDVQRSEQGVEKAVAGTGTVQNQIDAEKNRLAQATGFANQINGTGTTNTTPTQTITRDNTAYAMNAMPNQQLLNGTNLGTSTPGTATLSGAEQIANDPAKLAAFTQLRLGQTAAGSIQAAGQNAFNTAQQQLNNLQQQNQMLGSEAGRFQLLQQALGRPTYNRGQQRLDQLLVQSGGAGTLNNLQQQAAQAAQKATGSLTGAQKTIGQGISDIGNQAIMSKQQLLSALGQLDNPTTADNNEAKGAFGNLQQALQARQQDFIKTNQDLKDQITAGLGGGDVSLYKDQFSPQALQALGLKAGQNLYDVNLGELIQPKFESGMVTEQSVATPEQLAQYQALSKLAGSNAEYLTKENAGGAQGLQVDTNALQQALTQKQQQYEQSVADWNKLRTQINPEFMGQGFLTPLAGMSASDAAKAYQQIYNQYGNSLGGGNPSLVDSTNQTRQAILDWYRNNSGVDLSAGRTVGTREIT